jgi:hypothetical protein
VSGGAGAVAVLGLLLWWNGRTRRAATATSRLEGSA